MKRKILNLFRNILYILIACVLIVAFLLVIEFSPKNGEELKSNGIATKELKIGDSITCLTYNIGHAVSGKDSDCFLEGGKTVKPESVNTVNTNIEGIKEVIQKQNADIVLLQELDYKCDISYNKNIYVELANEYEGVSSFAMCQNTFVPYPIPNIVGNVKTGIGILARYDMTGCRINLPEFYEFPQSIFMPKKCIQKQYIDIKDSEARLVIFNFELEDYDDGTTRKQQLEVLKAEMEKEYANGNYVIAGGDFNMLLETSFKEGLFTTENYNIIEISQELLPVEWKIAVGDKVPTFRLREKAYDEKQENFVSIVDGFIVSPNVEIEKVETINNSFEFSNHNPVMVKVKLKK